MVYEHSATGSPATVTLAELHPGKVLSFSPNHDKRALEAFTLHGKERITLISSASKSPIYEADLIMLSGFAAGRDLAPQLEAASLKSQRFIAIAGTNQRNTIQAPRFVRDLAKNILMFQYSRRVNLPSLHASTFAG